MYITNNVGPKTAPCGITLVTSDLAELLHWELLSAFCFLKIHFKTLLCIPYPCNFANNHLCGTVSNCFGLENYDYRVLLSIFYICQ